MHTNTKAWGAAIPLIKGTMYTGTAIVSPVVGTAVGGAWGGAIGIAGTTALSLSCTKQKNKIATGCVTAPILVGGGAIAGSAGGLVAGTGLGLYMGGCAAKQFTWNVCKSTVLQPTAIIEKRRTDNLVVILAIIREISEMINSNDDSKIGTNTFILYSKLLERYSDLDIEDFINSLKNVIMNKSLIPRRNVYTSISDLEIIILADLKYDQYEFPTLRDSNYNNWISSWTDAYKKSLSKK